MPGGIRATVEFSQQGVCPLADLTAGTQATIDSTSTSVTLPDSDGSVTEFTVEVDPDHLPEDTDLDPVLAYGSNQIYRRHHSGPVECPCECLGTFGCPVARYTAREGVLTISFHAREFDQLQTIVRDLQARFPSMDIRRLLRSPTESTADDTVFVDRGKLTDRQLEVLRTAFEHGYFERPRAANANEIAAILNINPSTFTEHLAVAQSKLLADILEDEG